MIHKTVHGENDHTNSLCKLEIRHIIITWSLSDDPLRRVIQKL